MSIRTFSRRVKEASAEFAAAITGGRSGALTAFGMALARQKGEPRTDAQSNVDRYKGWVYSAATTNAQMFAQVPLRLYATRGPGQNRAGQKYGAGTRIGRTVSKEQLAHLAKSVGGRSPMFRGAEEIEELDVHPLLDTGILTDFVEEMTLMGLYLELTGNAYLAWQIGAGGLPDGFTVLPSQRVVPVVARGVIVAYELGFGIEKMRIPAEQVMHVKFPNPHSSHVGMAPLSAVAMGADRDVSMDIYEGALNDNLGIPPYAVTFTDDNVTEKDVQAYKREWNMNFRGVANAGKAMFGKGAIDIKTLAVTPREMAFLQGRKYTMEQIFGVFRVPPALAKTEGVPRANLDSALYQWTAFTITPRLRYMEAAFNKQVIPLYGEPRLFVAYDNCVFEDREFDLKQRDSNLAHYVTTVNEARTSAGLDPVEWGDVPIVQATGMPLGAKAAEAAAPSKQLAQAKSTARLGGIPGFRQKLGDPNDAPDISGGENPQPNQTEKKIADVMDDVQREQQRDLLGEFDRVAPQFDAVDYRQMKYSTLYLDDALGSVRPAWERGLIVGNMALPNDSRIDVGSFIEQPEAQKVIKEHTLRFLDSESESVGKAFRDRIAAGLKNGDSVPELRKRIEGMFSDEARNARSLMIARTESARAIELGREIAWQESGVVSAKVWDANGDSCPFCQAMHGRTVELGGKYWEKGDTMGVEFDGQQISMSFGYDAVQAPPLHPSCRCTLEPVLIGVD